MSAFTSQQTTNLAMLSRKAFREENFWGSQKPRHSSAPEHWPSTWTGIWVTLLSCLLLVSSSVSSASRSLAQLCKVLETEYKTTVLFISDKVQKVRIASGNVNSFSNTSGPQASRKNVRSGSNARGERSALKEESYEFFVWRETLCLQVPRQTRAKEFTQNSYLLLMPVVVKMNGLSQNKNLFNKGAYQHRSCAREQEVLWASKPMCVHVCMCV